MEYQLINLFSSQLIMFPVILLLDPLPMVAVEEQEGVTTRAQRRREVPTIAHLWFRQQELASRARKARQAQNETQRRRDVYDWIEETLVPQEPMGHFSTGGMASSKQSSLCARVDIDSHSRQQEIVSPNRIKIQSR